MKCPSCKETALTFVGFNLRLLWFSGILQFIRGDRKLRCKNCRIGLALVSEKSESLKITRWTILASGLAALILVTFTTQLLTALGNYAVLLYLIPVVIIPEAFAIYRWNSASLQVSEQDNWRLTSR